MDETKKFDWQRVVMVLGVGILAAAFVGGGIWYYMDQNEKAQTKSYNDSVSALQKQINETSSKAKPNTSTSAETISQSTSTDVNLFQNNQYGFSLEMPSSWKNNYTVLEDNTSIITDGSAFGSTGAISFWLPTKNPNQSYQTNDFQRNNSNVVAVFVFTQDAWNKVGTDGPIPTKIASNSRYVFATMSHNGIIDPTFTTESQMNADMKAILTSIKTF